VNLRRSDPFCVGALRRLASFTAEKKEKEKKMKKESVLFRRSPQTCFLHRWKKKEKRKKKKREKGIRFVLAPSADSLPSPLKKKEKG
jgi:hypothetical protein